MEDHNNLSEKIKELDIKIDKIYRSVEKTRRYFLWTLIISIAVIVLPLIGLLFLMPKYIGMLNYSLKGL